MYTAVVCCYEDLVRLRRFKSDLDEIWQDCSLCMHRVTESDFWYEVILSRWRPWRPSSARCCICISVRRLPASPPSPCDVIGSLYALQLLIHNNNNNNNNNDVDITVSLSTCLLATLTVALRKWLRYACFSTFFAKRNLSQRRSGRTVGCRWGTLSFQRNPRLKNNGLYV